MNDSQSEFVIRDQPTKTWVVAVIMLVGAVFFYLRNPAQWPVVVTLVVIGLMLLMVPAVEIKASRATKTVVIFRRSLFRKSEQAIAVGDIVNIAVGVKTDREDGSHSYRVEITLANGAIIPLRNTYANNRKRHEELARKLREVTEVENEPSAKLDDSLGLEVMRHEFQQQQEEITGKQGVEHITRGVHWTFETLALGRMPLSNWHCPDFHLEDTFVFLTQKLVGQKALPRLLQPATDLLFKGSMRVYGLDEDDTPDLSSAEMIELPDRLEPYYFGYSDEGVRAMQMLNPWVTTPLTNWAQKYAMTKKNISSQLVIHIGPNGLSLRTPGLVNPEYLDDLTTLGVELVRALGGGARI